MTGVVKLYSSQLYPSEQRPAKADQEAPRGGNRLMLPFYQAGLNSRSQGESDQSRWIRW